MAFALSACAGATPVAPVLREPSVTLAGTTRFDAERFAGDWVTVACLGSCARAETYRFDAQNGLQRVVRGQTSQYEIIAPGALRHQDDAAVLVVMWIDEGFRTAAIGAVDGGWAAVIDRGSPRPDRTRAAREVLEFNGWEISQMRDVAG